MLNGDGNDNGKSINISNEQKKNQQQRQQLCKCSTVFLYISLPLFCTIST